MSLRARLLAAFLLPTLLLLSLAGFVGYRASVGVLEDELGASLSALAGVIVLGDRSPAAERPQLLDRPLQ